MDRKQTRAPLPPISSISSPSFISLHSPTTTVPTITTCSSTVIPPPSTTTPTAHQLTVLAPSSAQSSYHMFKSSPLTPIPTSTEQFIASLLSPFPSNSTIFAPSPSRRPLTVLLEEESPPHQSTPVTVLPPAAAPPASSTAQFMASFLDSIQITPTVSPSSSAAHSTWQYPVAASDAVASPQLTTITPSPRGPLASPQQSSSAAFLTPR